MREAPALAPLPAARFDTAYFEHRFVAWDGYVDVNGNRYSVTDALCGQRVRLRIALDGEITVYGPEGDVVAVHTARGAGEGWSTLPGHHERLWRDALSVERRDLAVYEEAARWN